MCLTNLKLQGIQDQIGAFLTLTFAKPKCVSGQYKLAFQITISFSKSMVLQTLQNVVNLKPAANFCSNNCTKLLGKQLGTKHISEWHFSALCRIIQYMGLFCTTFYSVIKAYSSFTSYKFFLAQKCQNFFLLLYKEHFLVWKKEKDPYLLLFC